MPSSPTDNPCNGPRPSSPRESPRLATAKRALRRWVLGLPERERLMALLRWVDGLSPAEIAAVMGIELGVVESIMRKQQIDLEAVGRASRGTSRGTGDEVPIDQAADQVRRAWLSDKRESGRPARRLVYSTAHVAAICGCSLRVIQRCCDSGLLLCHRLPGSRFRRIMRGDLAAFLAAQKIPSRRPDLYPGIIPQSPSGRTPTTDAGE